MNLISRHSRLLQWTILVSQVFVVSAIKVVFSAPKLIPFLLVDWLLGVKDKNQLGMVGARDYFC